MEKTNKTEEIEAECAFDIHKVCELLSAETGKKITPKTHWVRVVHEVTRDNPPWALFRLQALSRV